MFKLVRRSAFIALGIAALTGVPAASQQASQQQAPLQQAPTKNRSDANARVCEEFAETGSRLGKKRVCATRAEWADRRRQDREGIEKVQTPGGTNAK